jgi:hypothetical protein
MSSASQEEIDHVVSTCRAAGYDAKTCGRVVIAKVCKIGEKTARRIQASLREGSVETTRNDAGTREVGAGDWVLPVTKTKVLLRMIESCEEVIRAEVKDLKADAKRAARDYPVVPRKPSTGNMLEISIPDLHAGKLAWGKETGWGNYDANIAEQVFEDALTALLERTSSYSFDEVLFVVGNDLLHSDNMSGTTTAGTPLDNDGRYQRVFKKVREMVTRAIERLRLVAPVTVLMVRGNHDALSTWHLGDSLECLFAKCDDVVINNVPTSRKYHQWGKVMLMFTHGNSGKLADYPLLMAVEQPVMFGSTEFREAHTGDKHQLKVHELHGVRVRISPALCPPDAWHCEHAFVGNPRSAEGFVWNRGVGLVGTAVYTVPTPSEANTEVA